MDLWWFYFGVASIDCRCVVCVRVFVVLVVFRIVARDCVVFAGTCFDVASVFCFVTVFFVVIEFAQDGVFQARVAHIDCRFVVCVRDCFVSVLLCCLSPLSLFLFCD